MKKQIILTATLLTLMIAGCGKSPEQARKELGQLGIEYNTNSFQRTIQNDDELAIELFLQSGIDPAPVLCTAINKKDIELVKKLLRYGADPNYDKTKSLWCATKINDYDITKLLLDNKANPTISSLKIAIDNGNERMVKLLINRGVEINDEKTKSELLIRAISAKSAEITELLLDSGADPNLRIRTLYANSFLSLAVRENNPKLVKLLLAKGAKPNDDGNKNSQALIIAIRNNVKNKNRNIEITKMLLDAGANPNSVENTKSEYYYPALSEAISNNKTEIAKMLLNAGVNANTKVNMRYGSASSFLNLAVKKRNLEIVGFLLTKGANPNDSDNGNNSQALINAILDRNIEIIKKLLDAGANPDSFSLGSFERKKYVLYLAIKLNQVEIVKMLLGAGANPNLKFQNVFGNTFLSYAVGIRNINPQIVKILLAKGANPNDSNRKNNSNALIKAIKLNKIEMVKILLEAGANPRSRTEKWNLETFYFAQSRPEILKLLQEYADR